MKSAFLDRIKFDKNGLVPVIIQDSRTLQVLMLAYMNREALERTLQSGQTWFWSRSRQSLWHKGETSGHVQEVEEIYFDCDADALLIKVEQSGAACHEGYYSCFHYRLDPSGGVALVGALAFDPAKVYGKGETREYPRGTVCPLDTEVNYGVLGEVYQVIVDRKLHRQTGAYTTYLFERGLDKILKKVGEEATEVIVAAKNRSREEVVFETADLFYHVMVLLAEQNIGLKDVLDELARRRHPEAKKNMV
ncbi:MAG: bifunctional phosphoribosyl-AMP cyclohydrolase/phosphoribosyl-ATP diphosphatase HisIE [Bacillota bacterium]